MIPSSRMPDVSIPSILGSGKQYFVLLPLFRDQLTSLKRPVFPFKDDTNTVLSRMFCCWTVLLAFSERRTIVWLELKPPFGNAGHDEKVVCQLKLRILEVTLFYPIAWTCM
jgi:hypothetical protein